MTPNTTNDPAAPYACQITAIAQPCPRDCGDAQCAAPEAAIVPPYVPAIRQEHHRADAERLVAALFRVRCFACSPYAAEGFWIEYSGDYAAGWLGMPDNDQELVAAVLPYLPQPEAVPDDGAVPPFFVGFQKRAEELQLAYFAMKQRAEYAEAELTQARQQLAAREWVPCAERYPEIAFNAVLSMPVLVSGLGWPIRTRHYEPGSESWYDAEHGVDEPRRTYSHWQPLPPAPRG